MLIFQGQPVNLNRTMNISIINALWQILVGEKLDLDDPKSNQGSILLNFLCNLTFRI
jgi:hypothetical protein